MVEAQSVPVQQAPVGEEPETLAMMVMMRVGLSGSSEVIVTEPLLGPVVEVSSAMECVLAGEPGAAGRSKGPAGPVIVKSAPAMASA